MSTSPQKPTIVLLPGAWHGPASYDKVCAVLRKHGYPATSIALPSVGAEPAHAGFDGDVAAIRSTVAQLVEGEGRSVVLSCHSYSGMPGAEALEGLGRRHREARGLPGGVIRLVCVMSYAVPEGFCPLSPGVEFPEWMHVDVEKGIATVTREDARKIFYNDMSEEEADTWAAKLEHQSAGVFASTTTYAAWKDVPSTYVVATEDKTTFTPEVVDAMLKGARQMQPSAFDVVETCEGAGHCLMISQPEWLAGALRRAAGEVC